MSVGAVTLALAIGATISSTTGATAAPSGQPVTLRTATAQVASLRAQLLRERRAHGRYVASLRAKLTRERRAHRRAIAGGRRAAPNVEHALAVAAAAYGVSRSKLRRVAWCESTLKAAARNGRYLGLFQFGTPLWRTTPYRRFLRTDPYAASLAAAWAFSRGMHRHWPICGRR